MRHLFHLLLQKDRPLHLGRLRIAGRHPLFHPLGLESSLTHFVVHPAGFGLLIVCARDALLFRPR